MVMVEVVITLEEVSMNKMERHVLKKVIQDMKGVVVSGPSFDAAMRRIDNGDNPDLLNNKDYRLGWQRCYENFVMYLTMVQADKTDQIKYAGKPKD